MIFHYNKYLHVNTTLLNIVDINTINRINVLDNEESSSFEKSEISLVMIAVVINIKAKAVIKESAFNNCIKL